MTPALIVFAKVPAAGRVKTRLGATIGPEAAADLYDAFLRDRLLATDLVTDVQSRIFASNLKHTTALPLD